MSTPKKVTPNTATAAKPAQPTTATRLDAFRAGATKTFGAGAVLGSHDYVAVPPMRTGVAGLDLALGIGGLPSGRIVEIYGPESSGKTTLCLNVIAGVQAGGKRKNAYFIDVEHALDMKWAVLNGVDQNHLFFSQPMCGEDALQLAKDAVMSDAFDIVVLDSVAALVPKAEIEGDMTDQSVGVQARLMSKAMRILAALAEEHDVLIVFTNQIREKIGVMFGSPETQPGGRALKFAASVRIDVRRKDQIRIGTKDDGEVIGNDVKVKIVKNKVAPPFTEAFFRIYYNRGLDKQENLLTTAVDAGVVEKKGAWLAYAGSNLAQGLEAASAFLREHPAIAANIATDLYHKVLNSEDRNIIENVPAPAVTPSLDAPTTPVEAAA